MNIPIQSAWSDSAHTGASLHVMPQDLRTEVLVVGAGLAGILTAWRLMQRRHKKHHS